jgi:hypothetical protein
MHKVEIKNAKSMSAGDNNTSKTDFQLLDVNNIISQSAENVNDEKMPV